VNASWEGLSATTPLVAAACWALLVLIVEMFSPAKRYRVVAWLSIVGLAHTAYLALPIGGMGVSFRDAVALDGLTIYFVVLTAALSAVCLLAAMDYLDVTDIVGGEYYPLTLFAFAGIVIMAAATDVIVLFLGLETMSMAVYVLTGIWKRDPRSNEAALKYFIMGAFASAFMLYGIAILYGVTGATSLAGISRALEGGPIQELALVGIGLFTVGIAFKVSAVPFHLWTPDAYEGAPTSVTAFMSTVVKAGGFAAAVRVLIVALAPAAAHMDLVFAVLAVATMTVANLVALRQASLKRMLAYSSIAHTGYLLIGLAAGTLDAAGAMLFYLAAYGAMNIAAFCVLMLMARRGAPSESITDLSGLATTRPVVAAAMTIAMLSLTGIPPLGGFTAKLYLFKAALDAGQSLLVVVALLNSVISAAYYLGVVKVMYFDAPTGPVGSTIEARPHLATALALAVALTVALGVVPSAFLGAAALAVDSLLGAG
jgi:NADH-quinone oxidoreductase subunit N